VREPLSPCWRIVVAGRNMVAKMRMVHMHIVEEADLRGTRLSCVPRDVPPSGVAIATKMFFATEDQLVQSVMQAFKAMLLSETDIRHLLVLSAHGEPRTGTLIEVAPGIHVRLDKHAALFEIRPPVSLSSPLRAGAATPP
jgi:hypothetical protein